MTNLVQISPIKRMPFNRHYFDYSLPQEFENKIQIGQLVKIPLRKKQEYGIVIKKQTEKNLDETFLKKLKPISEVIFSEPVFSPEYLNFLKEISEMYFVSFNFLLKTALPPMKKTKLAKETIIPLPNKQEKGQKPKVVFFKNLTEEENYIEKNLDPRGQNLILVPTVERISFWENIVSNFIDKRNLITLGGLEGDKETFSKWFTVRNNPTLTIIATRSGLFYPWTNLKNIFLTNEGSFDYKSWDMAPRIQARDAALILAKHSSGLLHLLSLSSPSVETYFFAKNKIYQSEKNELYPPENQPWITDTRPEKYTGNFTEISRLLEEEMENNFIGDIFLFLNRRGESHNLYCPKCKKNITCNNCHTSLYSDDKQIVKCLKCGKTESVYKRCPYCQSDELVWIGLGVQGIKKLLNKKFSNRYDIFVWEKDNQEFKETKKEKIIIGTRFAFSRLSWEKIKLIAFLNTDSSLYIPEFKAAEELWQIIHEASEKADPKTKIILQTENPEHPVIASLPQPEEFYKTQLAERKLLGYPPYNYLEKIFFGAKTKEIAEKEGKNMLTKLKNLTNNSKNATISGPFIISPERSKNLYFAIILAKINYAAYKTELKKISQILTDEWKTDPNPNKLLGF